MDSVQKAKTARTIGCGGAVVLVVLFLLGSCAYSSIFGKHTTGDQSDAFYACVDAITTEVASSKMRFGEPVDATYTGSEGHWTINGTYTLPLGPIQYQCKADIVSKGQYRIKWGAI